MEDGQIVVREDWTRQLFAFSVNMIKETENDPSWRQFANDLRKLTRDMRKEIVRTEEGR